MIQKHRISTNIGVDQKVTIELKQDFDVLEILSLKFSQQEIYTSICSDYGVVCGRVTANNGFGLGNARVSIFIPLDTEDENDPVISKLYPYKEVGDKNDNNYRYNLLPKRQQHGGHAATGTFFDQSDILTREECLEVYEKYYKFTVKTNSAGDFMIWGVPIGNQTVHVDVDLSDIGCFSLRPNDFQRMGIGLDQFKNKYTFKSSEDLDSLPQIVSFNKTIEVYPFWGNEELCEIGITRTDFDLSERGINIQPKAYLIGGTYTDSGKNAINKSCVPRKKMGRKCDLIAKSAKVEAIRFTQQKDPDTHRPYLEYIKLDEDVPDDGGFVIPIEMNMDYVITNEFGENEITNDPNKGIPTSGCYRFRFNLNDQGLARVRANADYLIPNVREYGYFSNPSDQENSWVINDKSYAFSTSYDDYMPEALPLILNNEDGEFYPKDYFYRFNYNKVYTVSSFQGSTYAHTVGLGLSNNRYLGLKDLVPGEEEDCTDNVTPPVNFGTKNYTFSLLIADVLLFLEYLFNYITLLFFNTVSRIFHVVGQAFIDTCFLSICPLAGLGRWMIKIAYSLQDSGQKGLGLITYPECEECSGGEFGATSQGESKPIKFCKVGSVKVIKLPGQGSSLEAHDISFSTAGLKGACIAFNQQHNIIPSGGFGGFRDVQQNYLLGGGLVELTKTNTPKGSYFWEETLVDISWDFGWLGSGGVNVTIQHFYDGTGEYSGELGWFYPDIYYKFYDEDGVDWSTGGPSTSLTTVALENGCDIYDSPYNEDLINQYYTSENGDRSPVSPSAFNPLTMDLVGTNLTDDGKYKLVKHYSDKTFSPFTPSGQSEFKNGMFYVVPGSQTNARLIAILKEHRIRKRVGKLFCGGIVSYSYIDNWLSGSLYFHQFKAKRVYKMVESAIRYCRETVRFVGNGTNRFYYRSTPILTGTTTGFVGRVAGQGTAQLTRRLNHPTTFVDLGPRDEFIKEICIDQSLDPNCSVSRLIGPTSFKNFGEILGLTINYRLDTSNNDFSINNFFDNKGFSDKGFDNVLDGDILQLASINSEVGIEEFDLQSPKYLGYSYQYLDPDFFPDVFKKTVNGNTFWGPTPITLELNDSGERARLCLNEPTHLNYTGGTVQGRLTESSQPVPFYLWDKKGDGFGGTSEATSDDQSWDYTNLQLQPLQGMTYGYNYNGAYDDDSDKYMLLPMTNNFSGLTISNMNVTGVGIEFDDVITGKTSLGDTIELGPTTGNTLYNGEYPGYTILLVDTGTLEEPLTGRLYVRIGPAMSNSTHLGRTITNGFYKMNWDVNMDFHILPKKDYYSGNSKQILSTPYQFYFGLKAGKTGLDKFIDLYGPTGAFPSAE
jgi:hypothetical protein